MPSGTTAKGGMAKDDLTIGVLSLQGDVEEHIDALLAAKADAIGVKTPEDLAAIDGLSRRRSAKCSAASGSQSRCTTA